MLIDGAAVVEDDEPVVIDGYNSAVHEGVDIDIAATEAGEHLLEIVNTGDADEASSGTVMVIGEVTVLEPPRTSDLLTILGLLFVVEVVGLAIAVVIGGPLFSGLADSMTTKRTIVLALIVYSAIAVWGFFLDSVIEFWFLAFMNIFNYSPSISFIFRKQFVLNQSVSPEIYNFNFKFIFTLHYCV